MSGMKFDFEPGQSGFTLIRIIIVLAVLAMLASVVIPLLITLKS